MNTDETRDPWIIGKYENDGDDSNTKNSMAVKYGGHYGDSPNPVKSRADIILTEMEKQLESTESTYDAAKERLRYTKFLYQTAGSISLGADDYNEYDDSPITEINSESDVSSNVNDEKIIDNNLASGDAQYVKEVKNSRQRAQVEVIEQSPVYTARSLRVPSRSNIYRDDENSNDSDTQNSFSERPEIERGNFSYEEPEEHCVVGDKTDICEEHLMNDICSRRRHPYQLKLAEYSKDLQEEFEEEESRNNESPTIVEREIHSKELKSSREEKMRKPELIVSESVGSLRALTRNKKSRTEKQRRVSSKIVSKQIDDTIGAKRKRKKRLTNSRCTTATTRDTSHSENKKDMKKRKQRGQSMIPGSQLSHKYRRSPSSNKNNLSQVVEIYHNIAAKSGSISAVSSKHSKLMEPRGVMTNSLDRIKGKLVDNSNQEKREDNDGRKSRKQNNRRINESMESCGESHRDYFQDFNDHRSGESRMNRTEFPAEGRNEEYRNDQCRNYNNSANNNSPYYDPLSTRNYELPTVASRLKQVNRSYLKNFRNIPFVVGTSVTPSYNLGLNIQEALSLIKTRQIIPGRVTPLLIRKVTNGEMPVSTLLGGSRRDETRESNILYSPYSPKISKIYRKGEKITRSVQLGRFLSTKTPSCAHELQNFRQVRQYRADPKIELTLKKGKTQSICSSLNRSKNVETLPELTTLLKQDELNIEDSQSIGWPNFTHSTKGIRQVLMNFHNQYEAMIAKFEKLQEQAEKTKDKSLDKEIASLESELTSKEEEINAVASLYQEVMMLKQQMRMLHERKSLVCIATESPGNPMYPQLSIQTANPIRMINLYRRGGITRGPSTSTRLAGLLRQIKTFQKQLKSTK